MVLLSCTEKGGTAMYFQQSDLFEGLNEGFVKEFMDIGEEITHKRESTLFRAGDAADHFYVLIEGFVEITLGEAGHTVYTVARPGEVFGWSSLVGRERYSASAQCKAATTILRLDIGRLNQVLEKDPQTGMVFFKRLARTLGNRLIQTYSLNPQMANVDISRSFGTGQVIEPDEKV
jgi:CRP-like cAMP-binding protein